MCHLSRNTVTPGHATRPSDPISNGNSNRASLLSWLQTIAHCRSTRQQGKAERLIGNTRTVCWLGIDDARLVCERIDAFASSFRRLSRTPSLNQRTRRALRPQALPSPWVSTCADLLRAWASPPSEAHATEPEPQEPQERAGPEEPQEPQVDESRSEEPATEVATAASSGAEPQVDRLAVLGPSETHAWWAPATASESGHSAIVPATAAAVPATAAATEAESGALREVPATAAAVPAAAPAGLGEAESGALRDGAGDCGCGAGDCGCGALCGLSSGCDQTCHRHDGRETCLSSACDQTLVPLLLWHLLHDGAGDCGCGASAASPPPATEVARRRPPPMPTPWQPQRPPGTRDEGGTEVGRMAASAEEPEQPRDSYCVSARRRAGPEESQEPQGPQERAGPERRRSPSGKP